jgi:hypothetical protein
MASPEGGPDDNKSGIVRNHIRIQYACSAKTGLSSPVGYRVKDHGANIMICVTNLS